MVTEQQQVAMIRTILFFMGSSQYNPTSPAVLAKLRESQAAADAGLMKGIGNVVGSAPKPGGAMNGIGDLIGNAPKNNGLMSGGIGQFIKK